MSALKLISRHSPRPTRTRITIRQFRELMTAIRELPPDDDDWRDEIPAYPLPAAPLTPADYSALPF